MSVLGPVRAWRYDEELDLGGQQQRALLALLIASDGRPVGLRTVRDVLWGAGAPSSAVGHIHRHIGRLRKLLEPDLPNRYPGRLIEQVKGGYRLASDRHISDLSNFRALTVEARLLAATDELDQALDVARQGLDLWKGPVAADIDAWARTHPIFAWIDQEHRAAQSAAADLVFIGARSGELEPAQRQPSSGATWRSTFSMRCAL